MTFLRKFILNAISDTIAGDQNDYAPTGIADADIVRVNPGVASRTITGIVAPAATKRLTVVNVGGGFSDLSTLFGGTDEYVAVGDVAALQFERTNTFSFSFWFKTTFNAAPQLFIGKQESSTDTNPFRGYQVQLLPASQMAFFLTNGAGNDTSVRTNTSTFDDGLWHHCVCTYDGSSIVGGMAIYIDGISQALTTISNNLSATILTTAPFLIGARDSDGTIELPVTGNIDDVAVYDKELTSGEVTTIYNNGAPNDLTSFGPTASLVGYWLMGDGATFPILPDDSANSNDGTMTNMEAGDIVSDVPSVVVNLIFPNQAAGSAALNRFRLADDANVILGPGGLLQLWYDKDSGRWRATA